MELFGEHIVTIGALYNIVEIRIYKSIPTPIQWIAFIDNLKMAINNIKTRNIHFGFVIDINKLGLISINYIKEYIKIIESEHVLFEDKLLCSCIINKNVFFIKKFMRIIYVYYKTKKEIIFIESNPEDIFSKKILEI